MRKNECQGQRRYDEAADKVWGWVGPSWQAWTTCGERNPKIIAPCPRFSLSLTTYKMTSSVLSVLDMIHQHSRERLYVHPLY